MWRGVDGASISRLKRNTKRGETIMRDPERVSPSTHRIQAALIHRGIAAQSFQMNLFGAFVYHAREYWIILCWINRHRFVYLQEKDYLNKMSVTNNACKTQEKGFFSIAYCNSLKEIHHNKLYMFACCCLLSLVFYFGYNFSCNGVFNHVRWQKISSFIVL